MLRLLGRTSCKSGSRQLAVFFNRRNQFQGQIRCFAKGWKAEWDNERLLSYAGEDEMAALTDSDGEDGQLGDAFEEDFIRLEQSYLAQAQENDDGADNVMMLKELEALHAQMTDEDKVLGGEWIMNPSNDTYYNPETGKTKVPFEKSWKEYERRRAERMRTDVLEAENDFTPDYLTPIKMHPAGALYPEDQMRITRQRYNHLNFDEINDVLKKADNKFFEFPSQPNLLPFGPQRARNEYDASIKDWELEELKFLGLLPYKFHVGLFRRTHSTKVGRKHSYGSLVVGGTGNGWAGFGYGKGLTPDQATKRAAAKMKDNLTDIPLDEGRTIPRSIVGRDSTTLVVMNRCKRGHGCVAGPVMQAVAESVGLQDLSTKVLGSSGKKPIRVVRAAFKGLASLVHPRQMALARGVNYYEAFERTIREKPPTRDQMKHKSIEIQQYMEMASKEYRRRIDLHPKKEPEVAFEDMDEINREIAQIDAEVEVEQAAKQKGGNRKRRGSY